MAKKSFYKIEMLFLKVLEQEDCYGYQLTQSIQDITNGQIKIAEGTMYPILYKLQDKGYISDRQVKVGKRQTRVYYHLEPAGKEYLSQLTHDYYQMIDAIQAVLDLFPDLSYEKLVEQFGTPKEVVMEYYANADDDYLLKRMNFVKHVRIFLSVIAFALIVFFAYRSYVIYESFQEIKDSKIIYENQGSIEELPQK